MSPPHGVRLSFFVRFIDSIDHHHLHAFLPQNQASFSWAFASARRTYDPNAHLARATSEPSTVVPEHRPPIGSQQVTNPYATHTFGPPPQVQRTPSYPQLEQIHTPRAPNLRQPTFSATSDHRDIRRAVVGSTSFEHVAGENSFSGRPVSLTLLCAPRTHVTTLLEGA